MPKRSAAYISDNQKSPPDDSTDFMTGNSKKARTSSFSSASAILDGAQKIDDNGDTFWELNAKGTRRVTISEFKGRNMVNLREYYEKDGKMLPGKKGISLLMEQFSAFLEAVPQIEATLHKRGEQVPRPEYRDYRNGPRRNILEETSRVMDESKADSSETQKIKKAKANYEDTSEEDSMLE